MSVDLNLIGWMVGAGFIAAKGHPTEPLTIYNYTQRAQYEAEWNEATLACRGLILSDTGTIVARPFRKFFNLDQLPAIPSGPFVAHDKLDGSLGIAYPMSGGPAIATRGSFTSDQASWATGWLRSSTEHTNAVIDAIDDGVTLLFEIIYPGNRIVVDYGDRAELVLLAAIDNATGQDVDPARYSWPGAVTQPMTGDIDELRQARRDNAEGYVLRWPDGTRAKIKHDEYVRLHRLLTGVNARRIWEILANGDPLDPLLDVVPDEFYAWVQATVADLTDQFEALEHSAAEFLATVPSDAPRRDQAEIIKTFTHPGLVFSMLDGKPHAPAIWRLIKPEPSPPFWNDEDAA